MSGLTTTVLAAALVRSGDLVVAGALFGVATHDAAIGQEVEVDTSGSVFTLPKIQTEAWDFGQALYWNAAERKVTEVEATNRKIGVGVDLRGAPAGSPTAAVRLNASF